MYTCSLAVRYAMQVAAASPRLSWWWIPGQALKESQIEWNWLKAFINFSRSHSLLLTCGSCVHICIFGRHLYDDGICFANVAFLESMPLTPINRFLQNFDTWCVCLWLSVSRICFYVLVSCGPSCLIQINDWLMMIVSVGSTTLRREFLGIGPRQNLGPKNCIFSRANISSKEHDID